MQLLHCRQQHHRSVFQRVRFSLGPKTGAPAHCPLHARGASLLYQVEWLDDGTPVINSVCAGPGDDTNFLYYFGDSLNKSAPGLDLAKVGDLTLFEACDFVLCRSSMMSQRIEWAVEQYAEEGKPVFLMAFGGLGVCVLRDFDFSFAPVSIIAVWDITCACVTMSACRP